VEEYEYRWDREFAITRICTFAFCWALLFGLPSLVLWVIMTDRPVKETLVFLGWLGLTALCTTVTTRKYWKRLSQRGPQLEFRRDHLKAVQLGDRVVPWSEVVKLGGQEVGPHRDVASLTLVTTQGKIDLNIEGLDAPMVTIMRQAEAVAIASRTRDSE